jgi:hypothetical protein
LPGVRKQFTEEALKTTGTMGILNSIFEGAGLKGNFATKGRSTLVQRFNVYINKQNKNQLEVSFEREGVSPEM